MSNTQPTPITDKNGKLTTVHKKTDTAGTSTTRVAGLGTTTKPTEKRTAFKPGNGSAPDWVRGGHKVELGAKKEDGSQNIYLNDKVIGSVSSAMEMQSKNYAGSRLRRDTGYKNIWRTSFYGAEEKLPHMRHLGGNGSRTHAVNNHADRVLHYQESLAESKQFLENGGIAFGNSKEFAFGSRGYEIELPQGYRPATANWIDIESAGQLSDSVEIRNASYDYIAIAPNDFDQHGKVDESGRELTFKFGGHDQYQQIQIPEDGVVDIENLDSPPLTAREQDFLEDMRAIVKQVMDTRELPNKMEGFTR
jgi:hypothetical protein